LLEYSLFGKNANSLAAMKYTSERKREKERDRLFYDNLFLSFFLSFSLQNNEIHPDSDVVFGYLNIKQTFATLLNFRFGDRFLNHVALLNPKRPRLQT